MAERAFPRRQDEPRLLITMRDALARGLSRRNFTDAVNAGRIRASWHGEGRVFYDAIDVAKEIEELNKKIKKPWISYGSVAA